MVRLNRIYTRTGDDGTTGLGDGSRRPKLDARVDAYGEVDETNCAIGLARLRDARPTMPRSPRSTRRWRACRTISSTSAPISARRRRRAKTDARLRVAPSQVERLEREIDALNADLAPLRSFVLPGGTRAAAALHQARAVCRRAERRDGRARGDASRSARRRSLTSIVCPTICSSPRASPTTSAAPTCCGFPAPHQSEKQRD